jgi:hypothetical protein
VSREDGRSTIICDIDGTIADHGDERGHFDYHLVHTDVPKPHICSLINALAEIGYEIIFVSGREESCRMATWEWLANHVPFAVDPGRTELYMRQNGDRRQDDIIKREIAVHFIIPSHDVWFVLEDRYLVVRMWREMGFTCLQVQEGNY